MQKSIIKELSVPSPRTVVLGAGRSGIASARILRSIGATVDILDAGDVAKALKPILELGANFVGGDFPRDAGGNSPHYDLCVVSPSIPINHPWCAELGDTPIISETELGYAFWKGRILAVTGSKGKSSIVKLCQDTLRKVGKNATACGNYGIPLSEIALSSTEEDIAVLEVSSFQMEHIRTFRPDVAIVLNLQADHLDRHGTMDEYARMKFRIFENMGEGNVAFMPPILPYFEAMPQSVRDGRIRIEHFGAGGAWNYAPGKITGTSLGAHHSIDISGTWFDNPIFGLSASAAAGALVKFGLTDDEIAEGIRSFEPLPCRMEKVGEIASVAYINDSKATSLAATEAALKMVGRDVRLIAGGRIKERDFGFIKKTLPKIAKKVYLIGEASSALYSAWHDVVCVSECGTLEAAVDAATSEAEPGDTVLLSPGCASFDQFSSYVQRGNAFRDIVNRLRQKTGANS